MAQLVKCLQCKHEFGTLDVHMDMVMHVCNPSVGGRGRLISSLLVSQSSQLVSPELVGDPNTKNKVESNSRRQPTSNSGLHERAHTCTHTSNCIHAHIYYMRTHKHRQKCTSNGDELLKLNKYTLKYAWDTFLFLFLGWCLETLRMIQCLTYDCRLPYNASANKTRLLEPLATGLFIFTLRRLGKT